MAGQREPAGLPRARASRVTVATLGLLAAFAGAEHGLGEIRQGSTVPDGVVFNSWEGVAAFGPVDGEPAMSVLPNLLVSGIATIVVALVIGVWSVRYAGGPHGAVVLFALSLLLLLVGGGFGPPILGVLAAGLAATSGRIPSIPPGRATRAMAPLWPWPLVVTVICFLGLVPGTVLLYGMGVDEAGLVAVLVIGAFTGTVLALFTARARDRLDAASHPPDPGHSRASGPFSAGASRPHGA